MFRSKKFWTRSKELQNQKRKTCSIPALKDSKGLLGDENKGNWCKGAEDKANLFAKTFAAKYKLEDAEQNEYSTLHRHEVQSDWILPGRSVAQGVLEALNKDSATGPDLVRRGFCNAALKNWPCLYSDSRTEYWKQEDGQRCGYCTGSCHFTKRREFGTLRITGACT